jgi:hypothetical protein
MWRGSCKGPRLAFCPRTLQRGVRCPASRVIHTLRHCARWRTVWRTVNSLVRNAFLGLAPLRHGFVPPGKRLAAGRYGNHAAAWRPSAFNCANWPRQPAKWRVIWRVVSRWRRCLFLASRQLAKVEPVCGFMIGRPRAVSASRTGWLRAKRRASIPRGRGVWAGEYVRTMRDYGSIWIWNGICLARPAQADRCSGTGVTAAAARASTIMGACNPSRVPAAAASLVPMYCRLAVVEFICKLYTTRFELAPAAHRTPLCGRTAPISGSIRRRAAPIEKSL